MISFTITADDDPTIYYYDHVMNFLHKVTKNVILVISSKIY